VNGRRAREIRWLADRESWSHGVPDAGDHAYRPQTIRNRAGDVVRRFPETRLMPGPRDLARQIRKVYTRTGGYPLLISPDLTTVIRSPRPHRRTLPLTLR